MAGAIGLDMALWWTPSMEEGLVTEAKVTADAPFDSVKKAEVAKWPLAGSGWLSEPLHTAA